jgi:hypothetical protein
MLPRAARVQRVRRAAQGMVALHQRALPAVSSTRVHAGRQHVAGPRLRNEAGSTHGFRRSEGRCQVTLPVRLRGLVKPDDREWLAIVPYGWARGTDLLKTVQQACDHGAYTKTTPARGPLIVAHVAPGTFVDGMGSINWTPAPDASHDGINDDNRPQYMLRDETRGSDR